MLPCYHGDKAKSFSGTKLSTAKCAAFLSVSHMTSYQFSHCLAYAAPHAARDNGELTKLGQQPNTWLVVEVSSHTEISHHCVILKCHLRHRREEMVWDQLCLMQ